MNFAKQLLLIVGAAAGGSALGSLLLGWSEDVLSAWILIFEVSLPFTFVGASLLTAVGHVFRATLDGTWSSYFPIAIVAAAAGPLMTLVFGPDPEVAFIGGVFALLTAAVWTTLHRTLRLPARKHHHA